MPDEGSDASGEAETPGWPGSFVADASPPRCGKTTIRESKAPQVVCAVRCTSGDSQSDVSVAIDQVGMATVDGGAARFTAQVTQSIPKACNETFSGVLGSSSGNFLNFNGANSQYLFHVLTNGGGSSNMDNVEVYTDPNTDLGGPVNVPGSGGGSLVCLMYPF